MQRRQALIAGIGAALPHDQSIELGSKAGQFVLRPGTYFVRDFKMADQFTDTSVSVPAGTSVPHLGQVNQMSVLPSMALAALRIATGSSRTVIKKRPSLAMSKVTSKVLSFGQRICFFTGVPSVGVKEACQQLRGLPIPNREA